MSALAALSNGRRSIDDRTCKGSKDLREEPMLGGIKVKGDEPNAGAPLFRINGLGTVRAAFAAQS